MALPALIRLSYGRPGGVVFLTTWAGRTTVRSLLAGSERLPIGIMDYFRLTAAPAFSASVVVVCDVERLSPGFEARLSGVVKHWSDLAQPPVILNAPPAPMRRYQLLKTLHKDGVNKKNIFRLDDPTMVDALAFPCFIRNENDHFFGADAPVLLKSRDELLAAIEDLHRQGQSLFGKVAIEFEDTRDDTGLYCKYSYFRVGDEIIPAHAFWSENWIVKNASEKLLTARPELMEMEHSFLADQPFKSEVKDVFDRSGIDYGRIDFGPRPDGGIHVFEINSNPNIPFVHNVAPIRQPIASTAQNQIHGAFEKLAENRNAVRLNWPKEEFIKKIRRRMKIES